MTKTIQFYRKSSYGMSHEYVANPGDAGLIAGLTGKNTIDSVVRELIRDLTGGDIRFEEILAPR